MEQVHSGASPTASAPAGILFVGREMPEVSRPPVYQVAPFGTGVDTHTHVRTRAHTLMDTHTGLTAVAHASLRDPNPERSKRTRGAWGLQKEMRPKSQVRKQVDMTTYVIVCQMH